MISFLQVKSSTKLRIFECDTDFTDLTCDMHRKGSLIVGVILFFLCGFILMVYQDETFGWSGAGAGDFKEDALIPVPSVILHHGGGVGVGNQLFMYAASYALARQLNAPLFIHVPNDTDRKLGTQTRESVLDYFDLDPKFVNYIPYEKRISPVNSVKFDEVDWFKGRRLPTDKAMIMDDYWESEVFFEKYKHEIVPQFELVRVPNREQLADMIQDIQSSESVAVHIRAGDFVRSGRANRHFPLSYQVRAMQLMESLLLKTNSTLNVKYFVFSDDIEYVKREFKKSQLLLNANVNIIFVSNSDRTSIEEFYLMTLCKHAITPNSTFSWWTAYLIKNPRKIVVAAFPKYTGKFFDWFKGDVRKYKELLFWKHAYPKGWITLNPFEDFQSTL